MDRFSKETRSKIMKAISQKWTKPELEAFEILNEMKGVKDLICHPKVIGNPDFVINREIFVFIDGCFWHKCSKHYKTPKSNKEYWVPKIRKNIERDKRNNKLLKEIEFKVIRVYECELLKLNGKVKKMLQV